MGGVEEIAGRVNNTKVLSELLKNCLWNDSVYLGLEMLLPIYGPDFRGKEVEDVVLKTEL